MISPTIAIFLTKNFTIMTDSQKATRVLNYLEEQDSTIIINLLNPFLDDYELALRYEDLKDEGIDL